MVVNHTTDDARTATSFLMSNLSRADKLRKLLVLCFVVAVGVGASQVTAGNTTKAVWVAVLGASIGVVLGTGIWRDVIRRRFIRRFQRDGMPRIQEELHQLAVHAVPVPV